MSNTTKKSYPELKLRIVKEKIGNDDRFVIYGQPVNIYDENMI